MNSFYSQEELEKIGFNKLGKNVLISKKASIYGAKNISIGNNVRIDDFCILSGKIEIGNYIHIAAYSALYGGNAGIKMFDFSGLSSKVTIYAISDDYSGNYLTNPTVDKKYTSITEKKVEIQKHVIVGASTVVLPGVILKEGVAVGSMSLVTKNAEEWTIVSGIPAKFLKNRSKELLNLEKIFLKEIENGKI